MSDDRLQSLFEDDFGDLEQESIAVNVGGMGAVTEGEISLFADPNTFTEQSYKCALHKCDNEQCSTTIMYFLWPEYDLRVGVDDGIYPEVSFTPFPGEVVDGKVEMWSDHEKAIDKLWQVECPDCGHVNKYALTETNSLIVSTLDDELEEVPIPRSRVSYVTTPKEGWEIVE
jgi:hypothetical protein